jgi:hypothetical protein
MHTNRPALLSPTLAALSARATVGLAQHPSASDSNQPAQKPDDNSANPFSMGPETAYADNLTNALVRLLDWGIAQLNTIPVNPGRTILFGVQIWQKAE